jgi:hypothetical protein
MADVRRIDIDFIESTALQPEVTLCGDVLDAAEAAERLARSRSWSTKAGRWPRSCPSRW